MSVLRYIFRDMRDVAAIITIGELARSGRIPGEFAAYAILTVLGVLNLYNLGMRTRMGQGSRPSNPIHDLDSGTFPPPRDHH